MHKKLLYVFILLIINTMGFSQEPLKDTIAPPKPIVSPKVNIDSTLVTYSHALFDSIFLNTSKVIDTLTFHADHHDVLRENQTIYSTLSNNGLAHKSMRFSHTNHVGFDMTHPSYSVFMQNENNIVSYRSVLPYSELRYLMSMGNLEQHFHVKFGRQFLPRLFVSFGFDTDYAPNTFINNKTINNAFWINANYLTKDERYGAAAYFYRNKLEMDENGGIVNDETYTSHTESDNTVIPTHLSSATNYVISNGIGFEHYFNLLSKNKKNEKKSEEKKPLDTIATDTINPIDHAIDSIVAHQPNDSLPIHAIDSIVAHHPNDSLPVPNTNDSLPAPNITDTLAIDQTTKTRRFTLGRICHSFSFLNNKLYYNESSPSVAFYQSFDTLMNTSKSTDTTLVRAIRNTLKWSSLGYQKYNDDIPFYLYAGVSHGFYKVKLYNYLEDETVLMRNYQQLGINGGIIVNLFKSTRITGHAELITLGYQIGDFDVRGQWKQFVGTSMKNYGYATFDAEIKRQSANWFEESYSSNHFRWDNNFNAATYLTFNLKYNFKDYCLGVKQTSISNFIYFGTDARPTQFDGMFSIREAYFSFYQKLGRFELEGFASLQKASNEDVMHLPLLMGQLKVGYSQPVFHKAATLHPSLTVRYFTKYYADAYMPATRTFYLQNEVQIGNFPFIDLAMAIKVKKAHIFVAYNNMFLLTGNYNSFIAPHYPMRDSKIYIGINWRLFN